MNIVKKEVFFPVEAEDLSLLEFQTFEEVKPYWQDLNQNYKANELALDWKANKLIWDNFYRKRGSKLKIIVGFLNRQCVGIFPLFWIEKDPTEPSGWYLSEDFIISREYFCHPSTIHSFIDFLPPHSSDDMSCFYSPVHHERFSRASGGVVELRDSQEEYLQSLKKKSRHTLKRTLEMNSDLAVQIDFKIRWNEIQRILKSQINNWMRKAELIDHDYFIYSSNKIKTDLLLLSRAQEMGKLIALYFYLEGNLISANFAALRETDRIDDYLCLRDCGGEHSWRGLGIFAILKNMEVSRSLGIRYYDFSSCLKDYKKKFINIESSFYFLHYSGGRVQKNPEVTPGNERFECATFDQVTNG
jgi:hypothetical protein